MSSSKGLVVAVSGGVDSVVLLDMLIHAIEGTTFNRERKCDFNINDKKDNPLTDEIKCGEVSERIIVAHFDHGIRPESAEDAQFVKTLADKYGLPFETKREELGKNASEEKARDRRYEFLREVANKHGAKIMTAHHADDVVETIAINLTRGTGWRGLAVLDSPDIERPLLSKTKAELVAYAREHSLVWHDDATNSDTRYLRNALRQKLAALDDESKQLLRLYRARQVVLKKLIDDALQPYMQPPYSRHFLIMVPANVAIELLRSVVKAETGQVPTRPQAARMLLAVKTYREGKTFAVDAEHELRFSRTNFVVAKRGEVLS